MQQLSYVTDKACIANNHGYMAINQLIIAIDQLTIAINQLIYR